MEFTQSGSDPIAVMSRRWVHSDAIDEPIGFESYSASSGAGSGVERAIYADRQGSVIWVTDPASGEKVAGYEYDAYGALSQTFGTLQQPYGYTGREYDAESGLYYYRARTYDPSTGLFLQSDPIGFSGGQFGLYAYVSQNPFILSDPSGLTQASALRNKAGSVGAKAISATTAAGEGMLRLTGLISRTLSGLEFNKPAKMYVQTVPFSNSGTCSNSALRQIRKFIDHHVNKCIYGLPMEENLRRMLLLSKTLLARIAVAETCYAGGDFGHNAQIELRRQNLMQCYGILTKSWKAKR